MIFSKDGHQFRRQKASAIPLALMLALLATSVSFLAVYLRIEPIIVVQLILFMLCAAAALGYQSGTMKAPARRAIIGFSAFSLLLDASLILGYHIAIEGQAYTGLASENYISNYSIADAIAFPAMFPSILLLSLFTYSLTTTPHNKFKPCPSKDASSMQFLPEVRVKHVVALAAALFILWLPYLFVYYPGLIFNDTFSSLRQALGQQPLSNHFPVLYTMFIEICIKVAHFLGLGNAAGCALYCLIQMILMSVGFSYVSLWIVSRCKASSHTAILIIGACLVYFGISPYIATYSIAMWKDPLFSTALMILTTLIADLVIQQNATRRSTVAFATTFLFSALIVAFFRNNGIYILAGTFLLLASFAVLSRKASESRDKSVIKENSPTNTDLAFRKATNERFNDDSSTDHSRCAISKITAACTALLLTIVVYIVVTGPVFSSFNIAPSPNTESLGIPLNQMARIAACEGSMTEDDRSYLDAILPIERYATTYRPCCTDMLKWDSEFNAEAVQNGFFTHWISMFIQNPRAYLEAWELQTFGFWAINQPLVLELDNIGSGVINNNTKRLEESFEIDASSGIQNDIVRDLFPTNASCIPISWLFWFIAYLATYAIACGKTRWLLVLAPSTLLLGTLLIASPIWYWPRYAAAVQFLLPLFLAIPTLMTRRFVLRKKQRKHFSIHD